MRQSNALMWQWLLHCDIQIVAVAQVDRCTMKKPYCQLLQQGLSTPRTITLGCTRLGTHSLAPVLLTPAWIDTVLWLAQVNCC